MSLSPPKDRSKLRKDQERRSSSPTPSSVMRSLRKTSIHKSDEVKASQAMQPVMMPADRVFKMFSPPLINSSSPWASSREQLQALYNLESTGAVTTRTALLDSGFKEKSSIHQHAFFGSSSINSYGYSPRSLDYYLESINKVVGRSSPPSSSAGESAPPAKKNKPFIISVTGTPDEVRKCVFGVSSFAHFNFLDVRVEINLSCPNIPDKPPPSYSGAALKEYLQSLKSLIETYNCPFPIVPVGIKVPPYTYHAQFLELVNAVELYPGVLGFITSTNTLGNSLMFGSVLSEASTEPTWGEITPVIASPTGTGLGGLAGESIHPLSLGNVFTLRSLLNASKHDAIRKIVVIGVGGVGDNAGYERMKKAGAAVVGVATAYGREGPDVFEKILHG